MIACIAAHSSEHATFNWLQQRSGLSDLIDYDFLAMEIGALYRSSGQLLTHKIAPERFLCAQERTQFLFEEVITLRAWLISRAMLHVPALTVRTRKFQSAPG